MGASSPPSGGAPVATPSGPKAWLQKNAFWLNGMAKPAARTIGRIADTIGTNRGQTGVSLSSMAPPNPASNAEPSMPDLAEITQMYSRKNGASN